MGTKSIICEYTPIIDRGWLSRLSVDVKGGPMTIIALQLYPIVNYFNQNISFMLWNYPFLRMKSA